MNDQTIPVRINCRLSGRAAQQWSRLESILADLPSAELIDIGPTTVLRFALALAGDALDEKGRCPAPTTN